MQRRFVCVWGDEGLAIFGPLFEIWVLIAHRLKIVSMIRKYHNHKPQKIRGTAWKNRSTVTKHQEDKLSKATSSLFPIKMIARIESNVQQNIENKICSHDCICLGGVDVGRGMEFPFHVLYLTYYCGTGTVPLPNIASLYV